VKKHPLIIIGAICALTLAFGTGCQTPPNTPDSSRPMISSLDTLTRESSPWYVFYNDGSAHHSLGGWLVHEVAKPFGGDWCKSKQWHQSSLMSINGQLPFPEVGYAYYWFNGSSPLGSLPIVSSTNSWFWEGVINQVGDTNTVANARAALTEMQQAAMELAINAVDLQNQLAKVGGTNGAAIGTLGTTNATTRLSQLETTMAMARSNLLRNINQKGIVVARWATLDNSKASITASDYGSASAANRESRSGFVILNGLRVRMLYPGSDIDQYYTNIINIVGAKNKLDVGVITYLLQTHDLAYAEDYDHLTTLFAKIDFSKIFAQVSGTNLDLINTLTQMDIALELYRSTMTQLGNYGYLGGIQWSKKNLSNWNTIGTTIDESEPKLPNLTNDWLTVYSVLTEPKALRHTNSPCLKN